MAVASDREAKLAFWETASSIWWFLMDACWMFGKGELAVWLALPTVLTGLLALWCTERTWPQLCVSLAMLAWLAMNILWMADDLGLATWAHPYAVGAFACGMLALVVGFLTSRTRAEFLATLARHFRRLRLRVR